MMKVRQNWLAGRNGRNLITNDGFFPNATTLFGLTVSDCWKAYCYHLPPNHRHKKMKIMDFVKILCCDMLENEFSNDIESSEALVILSCGSSSTNAPFSCVTIEEAATVISSVSAPPGASSTIHSVVLNQHVLDPCDRMVAYTTKEGRNKARWGQRRDRGKCMVCKMNTKWKMDLRWLCDVSSLVGGGGKGQGT